VAAEEHLDRPELAREYILLRLRTSDGLDLQTLETLYGVDLRARKSAVLTRLGEAGLIHEGSASVRLTRRGRLLTDAITQRLLPSRSR
jgi:oxygen-independent coproporphyrinogen-3 oxidase